MSGKAYILYAVEKFKPGVGWPGPDVLLTFHSYREAQESAPKTSMYRVLRYRRDGVAGRKHKKAR